MPPVPRYEPESEREPTVASVIDESSAEWRRLVICAQHGMELKMAGIDAGEFPLPRVALDQLPQPALEEIFVAQRKLLAELQRLRDANERLRIALFWAARRWGADEEAAWDYVDQVERGGPAPVHREEGKGK